MLLRTYCREIVVVLKMLRVDEMVDETSLLKDERLRAFLIICACVIRCNFLTNIKIIESFGEFV